jgi:hypothetical protein
LVEWRSLGAELDVDGFAFGLIGPFEIRAVTFGGIAVASALRLTALHHSFQDGSLQKEIQLLEFSLNVVELLRGGAEGRRSGCFA